MKWEQVAPTVKRSRFVRILNNIINKTLSGYVMEAFLSKDLYYERTFELGWHCDFCNAVIFNRRRWMVYHYRYGTIRESYAMICHGCALKDWEASQ